MLLKNILTGKTDNVDIKVVVTRGNISKNNVLNIGNRKYDVSEYAIEATETPKAKKGFTSTSKK